MSGHGHFGLLHVPGGWVENIAVDQQGPHLGHHVHYSFPDKELPHRLARRVPVCHLDGLVHIDVGQQVRASPALAVLVQTISPTWWQLVSEK